MTAERLPWWEKETEDSLIAEISSLSTVHASSQLLAHFVRDTAALFVYASNQHEHTLPQGYSRQASLEMLSQLWGEASSGDLHAASTPTWYEEGGRNRAEAGAQLIQHMKALRFFYSDTLQRPLTADPLQEAYAILMDGAVTAESVRVSTSFMKLQVYTCHCGDRPRVHVTRGNTLRCR